MLPADARSTGTELSGSGGWVLRRFTAGADERRAVRQMMAFTALSGVGLLAAQVGGYTLLIERLGAEVEAKA